jgi:hypothetical protein
VTTGFALITRYFLPVMLGSKKPFLDIKILCGLGMAFAVWIRAVYRIFNHGIFLLHISSEEYKRS